MNLKPILTVLFSTLAFVAGSWAMPATAAAGEILVSNTGNAYVGEYTTTGATVNASLFRGALASTAMAISGVDLFIAGNAGNGGAGRIGEYTTAGATVNASLVSLPSGSSNPIYGVAVSGGDLFVAEQNGDFPYGGTVSEYTTSGTLVNTSLVGDLINPGEILVSGSDLFVYSFLGTGTIGEYTTSGAVVNASLITGLASSEGGIALSGSDLFVVSGGSTIGEYTTSGEVVNASLITGLSSPRAIVVVPEPSSLLLLSVAAAALALAAPKRRSPRERLRQ